MRLTIEEVRRIARLARLRLSSEEEEVFVPQLAQVIDYFDQLADYPTVSSRIEEVSATLEAADEARPSMKSEKFRDNAPAVRSSFLLVPQVKVTGDD